MLDEVVDKQWNREDYYSGSFPFSGGMLEITMTLQYLALARGSVTQWFLAVTT